MEEKKSYICYNCKEKSHTVIQKGLRDNKFLNVLRCDNCGLLFLSDDSHIDNVFYSEGKMTQNIDLKNWIEITEKDDKRRFLDLQKNLKNKILLDFGCGNGNFLNYAKENCKKVYGIELQEEFQDYFKSCNLKVFDTIQKLPEKADIVTMFHVLEHLKDPIESLKEIKKYLNPNGKIIIEVPNSNDALLKLYRSKSFANFVFWSCHLFVYNPKNLKQIVQKSGLKVKKIRYIQRYSLMNHMYWLLKHKAGGHKIWAKYDCKLFNTAYSFFLKLTKTTDTIEITAEI